MEMGRHTSRTIHFTLLILPASKKKRCVLPHRSLRVSGMASDGHGQSSWSVDTEEAFVQNVGEIWLHSPNVSSTVTDGHSYHAPNSRPDRNPN